MFGLSDAECFLLGWAVGATVLAFKWKAEKDSMGVMLKVLFMCPEEREGIFGQFDRFKKKQGL
jgi:hypothetical protein